MSLLREHWQLPDHYYDCTSSLLHQLLLLMCKLLDASCDNNRRRSRLFSTPKTWNHTSTPEFDVVFGPVLPLIQSSRGLYSCRSEDEVVLWTSVFEAVECTLTCFLIFKTLTFTLKLSLRFRARQMSKRSRAAAVTTWPKDPIFSRQSLHK